MFIVCYVIYQGGLFVSDEMLGRWGGGWKMFKFTLRKNDKRKKLFSSVNFKKANLDSLSIVQAADKVKTNIFWPKRASLSYQNLQILRPRENLACYHSWHSSFLPNQHFRRFDLFQNWKTNSVVCSSGLWCSASELLRHRDLHFCCGLQIRLSRSKGWE